MKIIGITSIIIMLAVSIFFIILRLSLLPMSESQTHEKPPKNSDISEDEIEALIKEIKESDYYKNLQILNEFVEGKTVIRSETGNAGFILYLDNDTWAAAYRERDIISYSIGNGNINESVREKISNTEYGDASDPIPIDVIYANEFCNLSAEVAKSHGAEISGLSFGKNSFNFAFGDGHELDFKLVPDKNGKPAYRVFWEQW